METKILIIDPDQENLALLKQVLTYEGFKIETASNGHEGLSLMQRTNPDMIVYDDAVPGITDEKITSKLKNLRALLLSIRSSYQDLARTSEVELWERDFLQKPVALKELVNKIHMILRKSGKLKPNLVESKILA